MNHQELVFSSCTFAVVLRALACMSEVVKLGDNLTCSGLLCYRLLHLRKHPSWDVCAIYFVSFVDLLFGFLLSD